MKVGAIYFWTSGLITEDIQKRFSSNEGSFEISSEELESLTKDFDVAFMHEKTEIPTLVLDVKGGKFRQR